MFTNKMWITNAEKKIKNPTKYLGVNNKYQGPLLPDYDFKFQTNNYLKIKSSLEPFNIYPTEIYSANRVGKSIFVVCFNNPNILWNKYEGEKNGSGQNFIYWNQSKINTTIWLLFNNDEIGQIINGTDPDILVNQKIAELNQQNN